MKIETLTSIEQIQRQRERDIRNRINKVLSKSDNVCLDTEITDTKVDVTTIYNMTEKEKAKIEKIYLCKICYGFKSL